MKTRLFLIMLSILLISTSVLAVDQEGGLRLMLADPVGSFGETVSGPGVGLDMHYGVEASPILTIGAGFNVMIYGHETRRLSLPLVEDFDLTTTNNLADGFLFAQLRPFRGPVQPYGEVRYGFRYMWTESKLEDADWWDDDQIAGETNFDDMTSAWSWGGGLRILLREAGHKRQDPGVFLDLKVMSIEGGEAKYLTEGDIAIVNNNPVFSASQSKTDLTTYQLGVVITF